MTDESLRIAACVVCRNEADRLGECLDSLRWVDELVVVDLQSEDGSADVARRHGARVVTHARVPIVELVRNVAADAVDSEWVLALDPDERVSPGLAAELARLRARPDLDAVRIPRTNVDLGHAAESPLHRYDYQLRMYRRDRVRWPEVPNALPSVDESRTLRIPPRDELVIVHIRNRSIPEAIERVLRYAPAEAQAMIDRGETFDAAAMVRHLLRKSHKQFVAARALDEGAAGFFRAGILVAFHFYVWAAFWHMSGAARTPEDDRYLRRIGRVLATVNGAARVARRASGVLRRPR